MTRNLDIGYRFYYRVIYLWAISAGQVAHSVSVPTPGPAQAQYGMQPRANYSMNMSEGVTQAPMMSRQMSHTQLSAHELQAKASNMQHHPGESSCPG